MTKRRNGDRDEEVATIEKFRRPQRDPKEWGTSLDGTKPKNERRAMTMTATGEALKRAGVNPGTFSTNHHEPSPTLRKLQTILSVLRKQVEEIGGLEMKEGIAKLNEWLPQWVEWYREADAALSQLQGSFGKDWRNSAFREEGYVAEKVVYLIKDNNPSVVKEIERQRQARAEEERQKAAQALLEERQKAAEAKAQALRDETAKIRAKATITLHQACEGKEGFVVLRVEYFNQQIRRNIYGWVCLECKEKNGHIAEATTPVKWLEEYGIKDSAPYWVPLNPPLFQGTDEVQFPNTLKIWLGNLWKWEEANPVPVQTVQPTEETPAPQPVSEVIPAPQPAAENTQKIESGASAEAPPTS